LRKPSEDTFTLEQNGWGRRRFAPAQPGSEYSHLEGRRDEYAADTRPRAGEVYTGERTVAPCPL